MSRAGVELVLFHWQGRAFALPATQVCGLDAAAQDRAVSIGDLLVPTAPPVVGNGLAGELARAGGVERRLRLSGSDGVFALRVQEPVTQTWFGADALYPLPPLLAARLRLPWIRALVRWSRDCVGTVLLPLLDAKLLPTADYPEPRAPDVADSLSLGRTPLAGVLRSADFVFRNEPSGTDMER